MQFSEGCKSLNQILLFSDFLHHLLCYLPAKQNVRTKVERLIFEILIDVLETVVADKVDGDGIFLRFAEFVGSN